MNIYNKILITICVLFVFSCSLKKIGYIDLSLFFSKYDKSIEISEIIKKEIQPHQNKRHWSRNRLRLTALAWVEGNAATTPPNLPVSRTWSGWPYCTGRVSA